MWAVATRARGCVGAWARGRVGARMREEAPRRPNACTREAAAEPVESVGRTRQVGVAAERLEEWQYAGGRVVAVEEDGTVIGEVQLAADDLHALAVHCAIVVARGDGRIQLLGLDALPRKQQLGDDRAPIPTRMCVEQLRAGCTGCSRWWRQRVGGRRRARPHWPSLHHRWEWRRRRRRWLVANLRARDSALPGALGQAAQPFHLHVNVIFSFCRPRLAACESSLALGCCIRHSTDADITGEDYSAAPVLGFDSVAGVIT